MLMMNKDFLF